MMCPVCEHDMREYETYFRCTNNKCKIVKNKCMKKMPRQSLYPHRQQKPSILHRLSFLFMTLGLVAFIGFLLYALREVTLPGFLGGL